MNRLAHDELLDLRSELLRVTASLVESIPRATQILLEQDLEGAEYQILADDEFDSRTMYVITNYPPNPMNQIILEKYGPTSLGHTRAFSLDGLTVIAP